MPKIRTPWGKRAMHAMVDLGIDTNNIADAVNLTRQYVSAIIYGRIDSPHARKKISDYLNISDSDKPDD